MSWVKLLQILKTLQNNVKRSFQTKNLFKTWISVLAFIYTYRLRHFSITSSARKIVSQSLFQATLNAGQVAKVTVMPNFSQLKYITKSNAQLYTIVSESKLNELFESLRNKNILEYAATHEKPLSLIFALTPLLFVIAFLYFNSLFDSLSSFVSSGESRPLQRVTFNDVMGMQQPKLALKQVIQFMKNPQIFEKIGARMRRGIILYGPSGTGKTTLAKACAGQAGVPFYSCNAAEFCEIYVGIGPKRIRQLFQSARDNAPSIIYIDQIDAIGNRRQSLFEGDGATSQKNSTINQLLSQMDGFKSGAPVLVIASTNRLQMIDCALLRAGRFDLKISVPLPNSEERADILQHHLKNKTHDLNRKTICELVANLRNCSGADLQNAANEAVYISIRRGGDRISSDDIKKALQKSAI